MTTEQIKERASHLKEAIEIARKGNVTLANRFEARAEAIAVLKDGERQAIDYALEKFYA